MSVVRIVTKAGEYLAQPAIETRIKRALEDPVHAKQCFNQLVRELLSAIPIEEYPQGAKPRHYTTMLMEAVNVRMSTVQNTLSKT